MLWLKWTPGRGGKPPVVVPGPGSKPVRQEIRINKVLTAVRMFLLHGVTNETVPGWVLEQIYEVGDTREIHLRCRPPPDQGGGNNQRAYSLRSAARRERTRARPPRLVLISPSTRAT